MAPSISVTVQPSTAIQIWSVARIAASMRGTPLRTQRDIDLRPDLYTHYYKNEFPVRYNARMDTRRWGPGERLVFDDRGDRHRFLGGMGEG